LTPIGFALTGKLALIPQVSGIHPIIAIDFLVETEKREKLLNSLKN